jgi:diguanylate cyclase
MIRVFNNWLRKKCDRHLGGHATFLFWMSLVLAIFGAFKIGEPLEDLVREGRNVVRSQTASGDYVFVGIDSDSLQRIPNLKTDRTHDAKILETIFAAGAKSVYYNDTHEFPKTLEGDQKFRDVLRKYDGRLFIGYQGAIENLGVSQNFPGNNKTVFKNDAHTLSLVLRVAPFLLSFDLPYVHVQNGRAIKSFAYQMSGTRQNDFNTELFRPDFSINASTIPTYSYYNIYNKIGDYNLTNKVVVIGSNEFSHQNMFYLPSQGLIQGSHIQIIGAETLKKGQPNDFGWFVLFVLSLFTAASILFVKTYRSFAIVSGTAFAFYLLVPLAMDAALIKIDILPGLFLVLGVSIRSLMTRFAEQSAQTNRATGIKNFAALRDGNLYRRQTLIAIKVRNFAAIAGRFDRIVEADVYHEISRRVALMSPNPEIYQSGDTLVWITDMALNDDLLNSLSGINTLTQASSFVIDDIKIEVSLAFGVEGDHSRNVELRLLDALANAESAARSNRLYNVVTDEMRGCESRKLDLLASFDQALTNGEIWAAYQPKFDSKTGFFNGAEALARWSNDRFGTISAGEFIALAESNNRITELTWSMLDHVMNTLRMIENTAPEFNVSINISPRLILDPNFESIILEKLQTNGLPPHRLTLEIIETEKLDIEHAEPVLQRLAEKGIRLSVDDYGTGQATLDYLRTDTFQEIKIDRKFVSKMDVSKRDHEMVLATIQMAHSLGKTVVAEGIEHAHIGRMLTHMGCDELQGFHYAMPMTCDEMLALVDAQNRNVKSAMLG